MRKRNSLKSLEKSLQKQTDENKAFKYFEVNNMIMVLSLYIIVNEILRSYNPKLKNCKTNSSKIHLIEAVKRLISRDVKFMNTSRYDECPLSSDFTKKIDFIFI